MEGDPHHREQLGQPLFLYIFMRPEKEPNLCDREPKDIT